MTSVTSSEPVALSDKEVLQVMAGLLAALFTALLSNTIVSTALPTMMADLDGSQREYTWVITASLLMMTVSTPIWGKLSDQFNKKFLVQLTIGLFVTGSLVAGIANSIPMMIGARVVQGLAMGGLMALVQAIMATVVSPRERGRWSGYMGGVMGVATVAGPLLGGIITDGMGWRWTYFVCIPLALAAMALIQAKLELPRLAPREVHVDYFGGVLISLAAALPMIWVTFAGSIYDWLSWETAAFGTGFAVTVVLVVIVELRVPEPIIPIRLLRNNTAALMIIASLAVGVAMFGPAVFLTQYFQLGGGFSPTKAGLLILPMIVCQTLASTVGGIIVTRTGRWKPVMVAGSFLMVIGLAGMGAVDHSTSYTWVAISMAVMGTGVGTLIQNIVLAVQNTVDVTDVGAASATIAFFRSLGGAIGVAALGAVLTNQVAGQIHNGLTQIGAPAQSMEQVGGESTSLDLSGLPEPVRDVIQKAYSDGFGHIFLIAAIVSIIALIAILVVRETPLRSTVTMRSGGKNPTAAVPSRAASDRTDSESSTASSEARLVSVDGSNTTRG